MAEWQIDGKETGKKWEICGSYGENVTLVRERASCGSVPQLKAGWDQTVD